jgi:hypothetical protein
MHHDQEEARAIRGHERRGGQAALGETEGPTAAKGPSARDRFPDQSVAIIAGSTAAHVTNKSSHPGVDWNG